MKTDLFGAVDMGFVRLAGAAVLAVTLAVPPAGAQTLEDALVASYSSNPTLLAARANLRATDEQVPQALAGWRPSIDFSADKGAEYIRNTLAGSTTATDEIQQREPSTFSLTFEQQLYASGRTSSAVEGAENTVLAERAKLVASEQDVLLAAATAFLNVFRDEAILSLNQNNEKVLQRQLEATRDRFEVGEITRTDVFQAQARLSGATADKTEAEADLEASRANYENVIGQPAPLNPKLPALPSGLPQDRDDAIRLAATRNPSVLAAEFDRRAAEADVKAAEAELGPEINLVGTASRTADAVADSGRIDDAQISVELNFPLYQQGAVFSQIREAKQTVAAEIQNIDQARRDAVEDATSAWEDFQQAKARVESFNSQIEANFVALDGVQREAAVGSRTVLDILDAEQELLDSRVGHAEALRDQMVAAFEVLSAVGRMTAHDLKLPVEVYNPVDHYLEVRDKLWGTSSSGQAEPRPEPKN